MRDEVARVDQPDLADGTINGQVPISTPHTMNLRRIKEDRTQVGFRRVHKNRNLSVRPGVYKRWSSSREVSITKGVEGDIASWLLGMKCHKYSNPEATKAPAASEIMS